MLESGGEGGSPPSQEKYIDFFGFHGFELISGNEKVESIYKISSNNNPKTLNDYNRIIKKIKVYEFERKTWIFSVKGLKTILVGLLMQINLYNVVKIVRN